MYLTHKTYLQSILVETPFNPRPKALKMTKNGGEMGCFSRMKCKHSAQNFSELLFTPCYCSRLLFTDTATGIVHGYCYGVLFTTLFTDTITRYCSRHYSQILLRGTVYALFMDTVTGYCYALLFTVL